MPGTIAIVNQSSLFERGLGAGRTIDIEITNRCNATCHFCPRDATPHQGIMDVDTFDKALQRAVDYRQVVKEVAMSHGVSPYEHSPEDVTPGARTADFDMWPREGAMPRDEAEAQLARRNRHDSGVALPVVT